MKKFTPIIILCICILFHAHINAEAPIASENILSEATMDITHAAAPCIDEDVITITKEIIYSEIIYPKTAISWTEIISGIPYVGTLYLQSFYQSGGKTVATYRGDLTPQ